MRENFLKLSGRAALPAAFLLALFLPADSRAQANGQTRAQPEWLRIMVFADAPVVGADVRVTIGGPQGPVLVDAKAATNNQGVFAAPVWRPSLLSEEARRTNRRTFIRISISGGTIDGNPFPGHLTADIALTDPANQILVVNPVTTLVSRVLDARPELKLDEAEALVRRFLKLPPGYSLGLALRQGPHYTSPFFSPVDFMAEARDAGGLDAFERLLLQELLQELLASPSATHAFRPPQLGSTGTSYAAPLLRSTARSDAAPLLGSMPTPPLPSVSVIQAGLYAGVLDYASNEGLYSTVGWALSITGLVPTDDTTEDDIDAVLQSLVDLQSSVNNLTHEVDQLNQLVKATATEELYNTIVTPAQNLANDVYTVENRLMFYAEDCPPLPAGSTPAPPTPDDYCYAERERILNVLSNEPIYSAYANVEGAVQDNPMVYTEGMLHLYSLWLGQSKQFFRPADSTKMQNLYNYWDGVLTETADLTIEFLHGEGEQKHGGHALIAFMGNPDANPPTTGTFQFDQANNLKLMFPPVPVDPQTRATTVISTQDPNHTMWALVPWVQIGTDANGGPLFQPSPRCWLGPGWTLTNGSRTPYAGFGNWANGSKPQWQAAVSLAPTDGSVHWLDWLIQQTQTTDDESPVSPGFFNTTGACPGQGYPVAGGIWTSTGSGATFWYMDPIGNSFQQLNGGLNGKDTSGFFFPVRTLEPGEQYYWYQ
jgi:hypothetical protein